MYHPPGASTNNYILGYPLSLLTCDKLVIYLPVFLSKNLILYAYRSISNISS